MAKRLSQIIQPFLSKLSTWVLLAALTAFQVHASEDMPAQARDDNNNEIQSTATAIFAGGCFWCMQPPYDKLPGVESTVAGYTGGNVENPTYEQVSTGTTGHIESVKVIYDPDVVSYDTLLDVFWHNIDPLDGEGQFCDRGYQYTSAIFYLDEAQEQAALDSKKLLEEIKRFDQPIKTQMLPASTFYPAEEYHQDYYQKNPIRYNLYRYSCGRDKRLEAVWGD